MPSPLAHVGVSLALYAAIARLGGLDRRSCAVIAFASCAPDLDLFLGIATGDPVAWHRGPTHSLVGAAAIGASAAPIARGWRARSATLAAALLHVPMDWSTGEPGAPARYGVPWRWPWDGAKTIDPDPWFGAFNIDREGFLLNLLTPEALTPWGIELATVAAAAAAALGIRWLRGRGAAR